MSVDCIYELLSYHYERTSVEGGGPGVSLTLCCFVVYSTSRFVVGLSVCHFVLVFFSPFSFAITSLGEERANLSAFRTFVLFVLVWICRFPLPLGVWEGLRFVIVALPWLFSYLFLKIRIFKSPSITKNDHSVQYNDLKHCKLKHCMLIIATSCLSRFFEFLPFTPVGITYI